MINELLKTVLGEPTPKKRLVFEICLGTVIVVYAILLIVAWRRGETILAVIAFIGIGLFASNIPRIVKWHIANGK